VNISAFFIRRPVATILMTVAIIIAGCMAFVKLPVASLPQVDFATITVAAQLPGASPEIMASSVATPLERQFGRIAGVTQMTSSSTLSTTSITLRLQPGRGWCGARRSSGHQCCPNLFARESSRQPDLPQSKLVRVPADGAQHDL
jgi:multidrug efflux pump subunit AcrB